MIWQLAPSIDGEKVLTAHSWTNGISVALNEHSEPQTPTEVLFQLRELRLKFVSEWKWSSKRFYILGVYKISSIGFRLCTELYLVNLNNIMNLNGRWSFEVVDILNGKTAYYTRKKAYFPMTFKSLLIAIQSLTAYSPILILEKCNKVAKLYMAIKVVYHLLRRSREH